MVEGESLKSTKGRRVHSLRVEGMCVRHINLLSTCPARYLAGQLSSISQALKLSTGLDLVGAIVTDLWKGRLFNPQALETSPTFKSAKRILEQGRANMEFLPSISSIIFDWLSKR